MCQSLSMGGQRCAAHTRPAYEAVRRDMDSDYPAAQKEQVRALGFDAVRDYACTPTGNRDVQAWARDVDQSDPATAAWLQSALREGANRRAMARDFQNQLRAMALNGDFDEDANGSDGVVVGADQTPTAVAGVRAPQTTSASSSPGDGRSGQEVTRYPWTLNMRNQANDATASTSDRREYPRFVNEHEGEQMLVRFIGQRGNAQRRSQIRGVYGTVTRSPDKADCYRVTDRSGAHLDIIYSKVTDLFVLPSRHAPGPGTRTVSRT